MRVVSRPFKPEHRNVHDDNFRFYALGKPDGFLADPVLRHKVPTQEKHGVCPARRANPAWSSTTITLGMQPSCESLGRGNDWKNLSLRLKAEV